jgi:hypothetical protein
MRNKCSKLITYRHTHVERERERERDAPGEDFYR